MLKIKNLETGYGKKQVLFGVSLEAAHGEIVAIIGPNGSGKSTILKTVCGLVPIWSGEVYFEGSCINGSKPARNVSRGITLALQGNRVFDELTVMENLEIGGFQLTFQDLKRRVEEVLQFFPVLRERTRQEAGKLSSGEQQMVALARALIPKPKLLMLDEPSLGLSPNITDQVFKRITQINREAGVTFLIVEQKIHQALDISHQIYSLKLGSVTFAGEPKELKEDQTRLKDLFL